MPDYGRLNIRTLDNRITNVNDINAFLNSIEIEENLLEYLESLLNKIQNSTFTNKDELTAVLSSHILDAKMKKMGEVDNAKALETLQECNNDLNRIKILSTNHDNNDSGKDIDYITFVNKNNEVEMLATRDARALANFIKAHALEIGGKSAEEIFHYFKEYVYLDVKFMTPNEMDTVHPEAHERAVKKDEATRKIELAEVEEYHRKFGIQAPIEMAVDNDGERLYRIGDGIIKFRTVAGQREKIILREPKEALVKNISNETTAPKLESVETSVISKDFQDEAVLETYREEEMTQITFEEFQRLLYEKNTLFNELTEKEEENMRLFASYQIGVMVTKYEEGIQEDEVVTALKEYMEPIIYKYEQVKDELLPVEALTQEEEQLVELYKEQIRIIREKGLGAPKLEMKPPKNQRESGVGTLVIILELAIVGMYILSFLTLAK